MWMSRLSVSLFKLLCVIVFLVACAPKPTESPLPSPTVFESPLVPAKRIEPTSPVPQKGTASITGRIVSQPGNWRGKEISVYAAPFYTGENESEGFFVLEPSIHPSAVVDFKGAFKVINVPPEKYVIVIGPRPEDAVAVQEGDQPRIFELSADQILDLGDLELR
jgi:hypothetical protein